MKGYAAALALGLFHQRLREHAEETLEVRLTHQQIESKLDDLGLHVRAALGSTAPVGLANQRGAKHLWIVGNRLPRRPTTLVLCFARRRIGNRLRQSFHDCASIKVVQRVDRMKANLEANRSQEDEAADEASRPQGQAPQTS